MEKVLNAMPTDQKIKADRILELNANHPVFETLKSLFSNDKEKLRTFSDILYTQALLIEGIAIDDPVAFSNAVCNCACYLACTCLLTLYHSKNQVLLKRAN